MKTSYLDWNASTPIHPEVRDAMAEALDEFGANPSSAHQAGRRARAAIDRARTEVAALIFAAPEEIIFTSGGSEANNLAIGGVLARWPGHVATTSIEHPSVADAVSYWTGRGARRAGAGATRVAPGADGAVSADEFQRALQPGTVLVTVMRAQNETGVLQPVADIAARVRAWNADGAHSAVSGSPGDGVLIHTDAVQAAGKTPVSVRELGVDLLSLSAHKMRGPKGTGALFIRRGIELEPLIHGGGHEHGVRGGTENVAGIVGLGRAASIARRDLEANVRRAGGLRDRFEADLAATLPGRVTLHGRAASRLSNTSCLSIADVRGHALMTWLDRRGIAVSTGAACHAGSDTGSAILAAMGVAPGLQIGALRVSFGPATTEDDVSLAVRAIVEGVAALRG